MSLPKVPNSFELFRLVVDSERDILAAYRGFLNAFPRFNYDPGRRIIREAVSRGAVDVALRSGFRVGGAPEGRRQNRQIALAGLDYFVANPVKAGILLPTARFLRSDLSTIVDADLLSLKNDTYTIHRVQPRLSNVPSELALAYIGRAILDAYSRKNVLLADARVEFLDCSERCAEARSARPILFKASELPTLAELDAAILRFLTVYDEIVAAGYESPKRGRRSSPDAGMDRLV